MPICRWIFTIILIVLLGVPSISNASDKANELIREFKAASDTEQSEFINSVITSLSETLPLQIDKQTSLQIINYLPSLNLIVRGYKVSSQNESIDKSELQEAKARVRQSSVNSLCSKLLFRLFIMEGDVTIVSDYSFTSGKGLFSYQIDKSDCIESGYSRL